MIFCNDRVTHRHLNNNFGRKALQPNPTSSNFYFVSYSIVIEIKYMLLLSWCMTCVHTPPPPFFLWKDDQVQLKNDYSHKMLWTLHCLRIMYRSLKQEHYLPKAMARKTTCRRYEKAQLKVQTGSHWKVVHRCKY